VGVGSRGIFRPLWRRRSNPNERIEKLRDVFGSEKSCRLFGREELFGYSVVLRAMGIFYGVGSYIWLLGRSHS
jgi:hypothetical protein